MKKGACHAWQDTSSSQQREARRVLLALVGWGTVLQCLCLRSEGDAQGCSGSFPVCMSCTGRAVPRLLFGLCYGACQRLW